jgi:hypothetical protein
VDLHGVAGQRDIVLRERRPWRGAFLPILGHHPPLLRRAQRTPSDALSRRDEAERRIRGDRIAPTASCQARAGRASLPGWWTGWTDGVRAHRRKQSDLPGRGGHRPGKGSRTTRTGNSMVGTCSPRRLLRTFQLTTAKRSSTG